MTELVISFTDSDVVLAERITLWQEEDTTSSVSTSALQRMFYAVVQGESATSVYLDNCPLEVTDSTLVWTTSVYVDVPYKGIPYTLSVTTDADVGEQQIYTYEYEDEIVVDHTDYIECSSVVERVVSIEYLSPSFTSDGAIIPHPSYTVEGNFIYFEYSHFAVVRLVYDKFSYKHDITISRQYIGEAGRKMILTKSTQSLPDPDVVYVDESNTVVSTSTIALNSDGTRGYIDTDFSCRVTCTTGDSTTTYIDLDVPACIESFLGVCISSNEQGVQVISSIKRRTDKKTTKVVYYDGCSGDTLGVRDLSTI